MGANETKTMEKMEAEAPKAERLSPRKVFMPRADIYDTPEGVVIFADMPGVDEKSVEITLENNVLTLRGWVEIPEPPKHTLAYTEYAVGDYERSFNLSDEMDRDHIEATVKNGVVKLVLPKAANAKTRKIAVKAE